MENIFRYNNIQIEQTGLCNEYSFIYQKRGGGNINFKYAPEKWRGQYVGYNYIRRCNEIV